jgi:hypothetical protein
VRVRDLELDDVWTFASCKQKRLTPERTEKGMMGDAYTFIGLGTRKLVVAWHLGKRDRVNTEDFISKVRWATVPGWFDVSTDGFEPYETAIDAGLYDRVNHSQVVKLFSTRLDRVSKSYSPARFVCVQKDAARAASLIWTVRGLRMWSARMERFASGASGSLGSPTPSRKSGTI